ncbi:tail protein [Vibrio phage VCPH]|nr:tail protein [Vibrio phage VCPH]
MADILQTTKDYLFGTKNVKLANLVRIELPSGVGVTDYAYYTDYGRNITYDGFTYFSGRIKTIGNIQRTHDLTAHTVSISVTGIPTEEIQRALDSNSYLGNRIDIWRVVIDDDGDIIPFYADNTTLKMFDGAITEVSASETVSPTSPGTSQVTYKCSNEFYELDKVNGRFTDDDTHRGIVVDDAGNEVPSNNARKLDYQTDLGFFHANQSINILATYQTQEKAFKLKKKSSWFGLKQDYSVQEYWKTVTKEVDLRYNLAGKYLPAVYGVNKIDGIPIFADTDKDNPNLVTVVYAFCEGEIDGFLDIWMDDKPLICFDEADFNDRVCLGRKRESGDTIGVAAPITVDRTAPSVHGEVYTVDDGDAQSRFWVYHGKENQAASAHMVAKAAAGEFYRQDQEGFGPEYWDANFKLLDTAYIIAEYTLTEDRLEIPTLAAEVQGRKVNRYNNSGLIGNDTTSLNPAWQLLDYITNPYFGVNIPLSRVNINSFVDAAQLFDIIDTSYEMSWCPYWRYLGWTEDGTTEEWRYVLQTNPILKTEETLFKNTQSLLEQVVASLNIVEGQYTLSVESEKTPIHDFTINDFIGGKIQVSDITSRNKYNSITASFSDPGNAWNNTEVTFFNSEFKQEDDNVEKKLNLTFPYITNYYTARSLAERELKKSRYNREVKVELPFRYIDLPVNDAVTITYDRFGWDKKKFLIRRVSWRANGKVEVTLREYEDDIFLNSKKADISDKQVPVINSLIKPPRDLRYIPALAEDRAESVGLNGYLEFLPSLSPDVTYYTVKIDGRAEGYEVTHPPGKLSTEYFSLALKDLPADTYTIKVRAVAALRGFTSSPQTLEVTIDATKNLPVVSGFRLVNGDNGVWIGPEPQLAWDEMESDLTDVTYELEIMDENGDVLNAYSLQNLTEFSYPYEDNKLAYLAANLSVGVYRTLTARIRARGDDGEASVEWTYLE